MRSFKKQKEKKRFCVGNFLKKISNCGGGFGFVRCYCNAPTPYHIILSTVSPFALTPLKCIMLVKYGSGSTYMNSPTPLWDVILFFHPQKPSSALIPFITPRPQSGQYYVSGRYSYDGCWVRNVFSLQFSGAGTMVLQLKIEWM